MVEVTQDSCDLVTSKVSDGVILMESCESNKTILIDRAMEKFPHLVVLDPNSLTQKKGKQ